MNLRNLYLSAGVLAVLAILTNFFKNKDAAYDEDPRIGTPIVLEASLRDTHSVTLKSDGETITIRRNETSGKWLLDQLYDMPVNMSSLSRLIGPLSNATILRLVTSKQERLDSLGFDRSESLEILDGNQQAVLSIALGKTTDDGRQFIRFADEDKAYLVSESIFLDSDANSWLDKQLVTFDAAQLRSIALDFEDGQQVTLQRENADATWTSPDLPTGKQPQATSLSSLINRLASISFTKTAALDDTQVKAAREHSRKLELKLDNGTLYSIAIGRQPEVKVSKEVETENADGETITETKEEVETPAGPVYLFATVSDAEHPLNQYMAKAAFEISSYTFTSLPETLDDLLEDAPVEDTETDTAE